MNINEKMELKWKEMTALENERELLFDEFEANKERIGELYFEVEIKKLQYMFLKREQLVEQRENSSVAIIVDSVSNVESINETCIGLVQKQLIESGYEERLKREQLI